MQIDTLFTGRIDRLLARRGVLDIGIPVYDARLAYRVDQEALRHADDPAFSERIRDARP